MCFWLFCCSLVLFFLSCGLCKFMIFHFSIISGVLDLLPWTPGLPQRFLCPWVIVLFSVLQGLLDHGHEGLELAHRPLQGPEPCPGSVRLLSDAWVGETPPGSVPISIVVILHTSMERRVTAFIEYLEVCNPQNANSYCCWDFLLLFIRNGCWTLSAVVWNYFFIRHLWISYFMSNTNLGV